MFNKIGLWISSVFGSVMFAALLIFGAYIVLIEAFK